MFVYALYQTVSKRALCFSRIYSAICTMAYKFYISWHNISVHDIILAFGCRGTVLFGLWDSSAKKVALVCLSVFRGTVAFCIIQGFENDIVSSANIPRSIRDAFFTVAITGAISRGRALINLWRTSSSLTPTLQTGARTDMMTVFMPFGCHRLILQTFLA